MITAEQRQDLEYNLKVKIASLDTSFRPEITIGYHIAYSESVLTEDAHQIPELMGAALTRALTPFFPKPASGGIHVYVPAGRGDWCKLCGHESHHQIHNLQNLVGGA